MQPLDETRRSLFVEVFKETNQHLRNTETKSLAITAAYLTFFTTFISSHAHWSGVGRYNLPMHIATIALSLLVITLQQWYRNWKVHYIEVCQRLIKRFGISSGQTGSPPSDPAPCPAKEEAPDDRDLLPRWMDERSRTFAHVDALLPWLTWATDIAVAASLVLQHGRGPRPLAGAAAALVAPAVIWFVLRKPDMLGRA